MGRQEIKMEELDRDVERIYWPDAGGILSREELGWDTGREFEGGVVETK